MKGRVEITNIKHTIKYDKENGTFELVSIIDYSRRGPFRDIDKSNKKLNTVRRVDIKDDKAIADFVRDAFNDIKKIELFFKTKKEE